MSETEHLRGLLRIEREKNKILQEDLEIANDAIMELQEEISKK